MSAPITVLDAPIADLDPRTLYELLALRVDVFVVEQNCAYRELDRRDLEPTARLVWATRGDSPIATLRLLLDEDGRMRIGRVATTPAERGAGVAALLMQRALDRAGNHAVVLDAQAQLEAWYERFGFRRDGALFVEDGIAHVPMTRPAPAER